MTENDNTQKQEKKAKIGFFNSAGPKKQKNNLDLSYTDIAEPKETYAPEKNTGKEILPKSKSTISASAAANAARKTLRLPNDVYYEFSALLELSDFAYSYELLAELVEDGIKKRSEEDPDFARTFRAVAERIKMTDQRKMARKRRK
ncbi:hypothetical protein FC91_GL001105 [Schleiferilactobacillus harbinensis DSM 16991]|jgi:hypothetical protein|uniref:Uncharacterized protein n=1 Tax=Schleiferilactobacillus harbinensis DSM 16991 TaxID=1122147 RepID=A0A0R1X4J9_9LACO|nr:hypothetical protein [Schleiferilactobacillus harbinensis]KRM25167.1 hypothetical protein FC91_GL001105 [Schleiferilactobacillus harbinensis DSM 16991]